MEWIVSITRSLRTHIAPAYRISAKWDNAQPRYSYLIISNLGATHHQFHRKWTLTIPASETI